jgi:D-alanyl-D-alanine carboxypeptidase
LLGLLIEKLSGLAYSEYLQQKIFKPLGISDARVFQYGKEIPHRVTGYEKNKEGKFMRSEADESIFFSTEADGGIYISMNNYLKWCEAVESGSLSRSFPILNAWQGHTRVDSARQLWYGYGWFVAGSGQSRTIYHTGFNGGFRTVVYMIPSINYCVTIFSNRGDIDLEELVSRINQIVLPGDNSFIKSGPLESFIPRWPNFAPCKETGSYSTLFIRNLNAKGMVLN